MARHPSWRGVATGQAYAAYRAAGAAAARGGPGTSAAKRVAPGPTSPASVASPARPVVQSGTNQSPGVSSREAVEFGRVVLWQRRKHGTPGTRWLDSPAGHRWILSAYLPGAV